MKKWIVAIAVLAGVALAAAGCTSSPAPPDVVLLLSSPSPSLPDAERTLASLEKADDYPLYVMTYYGDYGFDEFLEVGVSAGAASGRANWACTTFAALAEGSDVLVGRNFDWHYRGALVLFTDPPGGYASVSLVDLNDLGYRSNVDDLLQGNRRRLLDAPHFPIDGMNEAGVAISLMAVPHAEAAAGPGEVTIGSLHALRLVLDHAGDVDEAVDLLQGVGIDFRGGPPLHYLIADASGNSVVVEFIDDELHVLRSERPWQVSTNFVLAEAQSTGADSPCWRYNRVYRALEEAEGSFSTEQALDLLDVVHQGHTMWSVVYDVTNGKAHVVPDDVFDAAYEFALDGSVQRRQR